jgi:hypothetical protein
MRLPFGQMGGNEVTLPLSCASCAGWGVDPIGSSDLYRAASHYRSISVDWLLSAAESRPSVAREELRNRTSTMNALS